MVTQKKNGTGCAVMELLCTCVEMQQMKTRFIQTVSLVGGKTSVLFVILVSTLVRLSEDSLTR